MPPLDAKFLVREFRHTPTVPQVFAMAPAALVGTQFGKSCFALPLGRSLGPSFTRSWAGTGRFSGIQQAI